MPEDVGPECISEIASILAKGYLRFCRSARSTGGGLLKGSMSAKLFQISTRLRPLGGEISCLACYPRRLPVWARAGYGIHGCGRLQF